jgi:opacity protein-like surface antigen
MILCTNAQLIFLSILFSISVFSNPFEIVRELDIGARASLTYDSNLFGVSEPVYQIADELGPYKDEIESRDDFIINFSPSLHFSKKIYLLNISGSAGVSMTRYIKNADKSFIVPVTTLSLDFDESLKKRLSTNAKIRFDATFDLGQHVDTSIVDQDLVSYTYFTTNLNVRYNHSAKFGVGAGTSFSFRDYQSGAVNNTYNDLTTLPLSLRAFYIYSEKLDIFTDYTTTLSMSDDSKTNAADSQSHAISFGLNGEYSSKLSGRMSLGYSWMDYDNANLSTTDNFVSSLDLSWTHNSKTSTSYFINRQFSPTAQGSSTFSTNLGVRVDHKLTDRFRGFASTNYSIIDYTLTSGVTSKLDQIALGIGVDYNWTDSIMVGSAYNFSFINNKDENYDRHTLEIYASGRF